MRRLFALLALAFIFPNSVHAAAWLKQEDEATVSVDWLGSQATDAKGSSGMKLNGPDYTKNDIQIRMEYGVTGETTVFVAPTYTTVSYKNGVSNSGFNDIQIGARHLLWWKDNSVLSGEISAFLPGAETLNAGGTDIEGRILFGSGFQVLGKPSFINAELGMRMRSGGPANEIRPDFTFGMQLNDKWQATLSSLNIYTFGGAEIPYTDIEQHKIQVGASYALSDALTLRGGVWTTVAGFNAAEENGFTFGFSNDF